jgi:hypothetical protein
MRAAICIVVMALARLVMGDEPLPDAKPVPRVQVVPQPYEQASVQLAGQELTRFHFGSALRRPFLFPVNGPGGGHALTRMGHPHDAVGHGHHNSIWISHHDVGGVDFWGDAGGGKIVYRPLVRDAYVDGDDAAVIRARFDWIEEKGQRLLLKERRQISVMPLDEKAWLVILDLELTPEGEEITFGKTPFGLVGVRMAKTIGVTDGGGRILNSAGQRDEQEILWKPAKWVDYSGPTARVDNGITTGGITLMDHPANPNHPTGFHVRNDGWMGTSLTLNEPLVVRKNSPLRLRYGLSIHGGVPSLDEASPRFAYFAEQALPNWQPWK